METLTPVIIATFLIAVFAFAMGMAFCWIITHNSTVITDSKIRLVLTIIVTIIWMLAVVADILITGFTMSPLIHAIMGAIVGYFFTQDGLDLTGAE